MKIKEKDNYLSNFDSRYVDLPYNAKIDWDDYEKTVNKNFDLLKEINERCKASGSLLGRYFETAVADGFAYYQVVETTKTKARVVRCVGFGDDYRDPQFMDEALVDIGYIQMLVEATDKAKKYTFSVSSSKAQENEQDEKNESKQEQISTDNEKISLINFLNCFDFSCEIMEPDLPDEKAHRLKLLDEGRIDEDQIHIPMLRLVDELDANLGDIEKERFSLHENLAIVLIERLDSYINDYVMVDFENELEFHGVENVSKMSLEDMVNKSKELGIESGVDYTIANYIIHPELIDISDFFNDKQMECFEAINKILSENNYNAKQEKEIREGITNGLSLDKVSLYANPIFDEWQMFQIRKGLESGLSMEKVEFYAKSEFDGWQMSEILAGLKSVKYKKFVELYAKPEFDHSQMAQIRMGLRQLSLEQVKLYADSKFNFAQMHEIRKAFLQGMTLGAVDILAKPEFNAEHMALIRKCFENGWPESHIKLLSNIKLNRPQAKQIYDGFVHGLSFDKLSFYARPEFPHWQMKEIRLGLERGLSIDEVKTYAISDLSLRKVMSCRRELKKKKASNLDAMIFNAQAEKLSKATSKNKNYSIEKNIDRQ